MEKEGAGTIMTNWGFGNTYFNTNWGLAQLIMIFSGRGATIIMTNWGYGNTYFDTNLGLAPLIIIFTGRGGYNYYEKLGIWHNLF